MVYDEAQTFEGTFSFSSVQMVLREIFVNYSRGSEGVLEMRAGIINFNGFFAPLRSDLEAEAMRTTLKV